MTHTLRCLALVLAASIAFPIVAAAADIPVTGRAVAGLEPFDRLMIDFLAEHHGVGAALAVTRNGKLVYARGFGWADREARQAVEPGAIFRIASCSKTLTAVTVLHLVEQEKLKLTDRVFPALINPIAHPRGSPDPRLDSISVLELLQHRGGFDRDVSLDLMFQSVAFAELCGVNPPAMQNDIISVMAGRRLDFNPGDHYAYSNFGYCLLGRIIEKVTGENYGAYVTRSVLAPQKIARMRLGRTLPKFRAPGEVEYYTIDASTGPSVFPPVGESVPQPYGCWCIEAMDSHGGWLASAPELVKFASALDDPNSSGILDAASVSEMFRRPPGLAGLEGQTAGAKPAVVWYGCGWQVRDVGGGRINTWHAGLLYGTATLMVRRADGLDWVVLFNQDRDQNGKILSGEIDPLVHGAANAVKIWPEGLGRDNLWP